MLGGLLLDNDGNDRIGPLVATDFYRPDHALIFEHIQRLIERAAIAADMLVRRTDLSEADKEGLVEATKLTPGFNDFRSVANSKDSGRRYSKFAKTNKAENAWAQIQTANRHDGRVNSLLTFKGLLETYKPKTGI